MPWQETLLMDQRVQFIGITSRDMFDVAELARRYGISRKTATNGSDRYDVGGPVGLVDRSRRPAHCLARNGPADDRGVWTCVAITRGAQEAPEDRGRRHPTGPSGPEYSL